MTPLESNIFPNHNHKMLSVQVSLNGLSFLIAKDENEELSFIEERWTHSTTPDELLIALEKLFLRLPREYSFSKIKVIYSTPVHTVIPSDFFDESKGSEYLKFNSKILVNDYVAHDQLDAQNLTVLYVPYMNINNAIFEKLGSFDYYHAITLLLDVFSKKHDPRKTEIFIHVRESFFDCIILKQNRLELCNSFPYSSPEDFLYYLLFAMEQLNLNPEEIPVFFCGTISEGDDLFSLAYDYIRNIIFLDTAEPESKIPFLLKNSL